MERSEIRGPEHSPGFRPRFAGAPCGRRIERSVFLRSVAAPEPAPHLMRGRASGMRLVTLLRLIEDALQRRGIIEKSRRNPFFLRGRERPAELRPFGYAARDEVGGLERKNRRLPPLRQRRERDSIKITRRPKP